MTTKFTKLATLLLTAAFAAAPFATGCALADDDDEPVADEEVGEASSELQGEGAACGIGLICGAGLRCYRSSPLRQGFCVRKPNGIPGGKPSGSVCRAASECQSVRCEWTNVVCSRDCRIDPTGRNCTVLCPEFKRCQ